MSQNKRMKMCASCDGLVDSDVIVCPYCGSDLSVAVSQQEELSSEEQYRKKMSSEETFSSLYPPPYNPKKIDEPDIMKNYFDDTTTKKFNFMEEEKVKAAEKVQEQVPENSSLLKILPILLFSLGMNILLLGLYLLIFSTNGEIFIRWNAHLWYVYLLVGLPLVALGYKRLSKDT